MNISMLGSCITTDILKYDKSNNNGKVSREIYEC